MDVYKADQTKRKPKAEIEPGVLSEPEAARFLGIGARTLFGLRKAGKGPKHVCFGKSIRYPRHLLIEFLDRQAEGGAS